MSNLRTKCCLNVISRKGEIKESGGNICVMQCSKRSPTEINSDEVSVIFVIALADIVFNAKLNTYYSKVSVINTLQYLFTDQLALSKIAQGM